MSNTDLPRISPPNPPSPLVAAGRVILLIGALIVGAVLGLR
jgi:hypothetical protein